MDLVRAHEVSVWCFCREHILDVRKQVWPLFDCEEKAGVKSNAAGRGTEAVDIDMRLT